MYLTWLWLAPAVASLVVWILPRKAARALACACALGLLAYSLWLLVPYRADSSGLMRLAESGCAQWLGIRYQAAADGISLSLCWLTAFLTLISFIASWKRTDFPSGYWAAFLALEAALFGVFTMQNLFYFYVFWDFALIPMFFIIGLWGSENRRFAALKFVLYTFLGSLFLLVGIVALVTLHFRMTGAWSWDVAGLTATPVGGRAARWIFAAMALGFAVKIPLFPLHHWLPDAHTEAPAAGSVLLAGSMLKMGVYGFLRILVPLFPELSRDALVFFGAVGVINILYGAFCAMAQTDLKRLVAYTSISHLGFCMVGLFSLTRDGVAGAGLQMVNHGLSTGGLFLLIGMLYDRAHKRGIEDFGGLASTAPVFAALFGFILLSSIGLPGLNGFVGELFSLAGMAQVSIPFAALGAAGAILAAAYGLPAYQRVFWAPAGPGSASRLVAELDGREQAILWTLAALILFIGVYPRPLLELIGPAAANLAVPR